MFVLLPLGLIAIPATGYTATWLEPEAIEDIGRSFPPSIRWRSMPDSGLLAEIDRKDPSMAMASLLITIFAANGTQRCPKLLKTCKRVRLGRRRSVPGAYSRSSLALPLQVMRFRGSGAKPRRSVSSAGSQSQSFSAILTRLRACRGTSSRSQSGTSGSHLQQGQHCS